MKRTHWFRVGLLGTIILAGSIIGVTEGTRIRDAEPPKLPADCQLVREVLKGEEGTNEEKQCEPEDTWVVTASFEHDGDQEGVAFSPNCEILAARAGKEIHLWDVSERKLGRLLQRPSGMEGECYLGSPAFSADGKRLAWGTGDGTVHIWDMDSAHRTHQISVYYTGVWRQTGMCVNTGTVMAAVFHQGRS